jgi:hypothetical protein
MSDLPLFTRKADDEIDRLKKRIAELELIRQIESDAFTNAIEVIMKSNNYMHALTKDVKGGAE